MYIVVQITENPKNLLAGFAVVEAAGSAIARGQCRGPRAGDDASLKLEAVC